MIYDHFSDKWEKLRKQLEELPYVYPTPIVPQPIVPQISPSEIEEFRQLLDRAREYDIKHNQPNCELEDKKERIRRLAKELGVKIDFIDEKDEAQPSEETKEAP